MMMKRLLAGLLLTLGLSAGALGLLAGPAMAAGSAGNGTTNSAIPDAYTVPPPSSTTSSTDPCLTGNGTTGTTNGNCYGSTTPSGGSGSNTAAALGSGDDNGSGGSLAFTGTDIVGTVVVALVLIGGGLVLLRLSRRSKNAG